MTNKNLMNGYIIYMKVSYIMKIVNFEYKIVVDMKFCYVGF